MPMASQRVFLGLYMDLSKALVDGVVEVDVKRGTKEALDATPAASTMVWNTSRSSVTIGGSNTAPRRTPRGRGWAASQLAGHRSSIGTWAANSYG